MSPRLLLRLFSVALLAGPLFAQTTSPLSPSPPPASSPITVTAAFWNIQWFPGRRPHPSRVEESRQIRAVHRDLAQLAVDVIGLEEVRDFEHASLAIQPLSGFKVDVCSDFAPREVRGKTQQIAIASRLQPIGAWAETWRPNGRIMPPRGFAFAAYQLSPKQILLVYALHLKSNRREMHDAMGVREESMREVVSHMRAMKEIYGKLGMLSWIVGGDFNTTPDEPRFAGEKTLPFLFNDGFSWAWQRIPLSSRATVISDVRHPATYFDQIFYRGATLTRAWVAKTSRESSDHRAVNVELNLDQPR
jgi:endonuclease/exonuclease/phosphatase family metal-dependent hydrolase